MTDIMQERDFIAHNTYSPKHRAPRQTDSRPALRDDMLRHARHYTVNAGRHMRRVSR